MIPVPKGFKHHLFKCYECVKFPHTSVTIVPDFDGKFSMSFIHAPLITKVAKKTFLQDFPVNFETKCNIWVVTL